MRRFYEQTLCILHKFLLANQDLHHGLLAWHSVHNVIKFSSESDPEWLRNSLWCTSRFDMEPQD
jgi:hypothetical protein